MLGGFKYFYKELWNQLESQYLHHTTFNHRELAYGVTCTHLACGLTGHSAWSKRSAPQKKLVPAPPAPCELPPHSGRPAQGLTT